MPKTRNMRSRLKSAAIAGTAALTLVAMSQGTAHAAGAFTAVLSPEPGRLCAQPSGGSLANGTRVVLGYCEGADYGWTFYPQAPTGSSDWYTIQLGGKCLDAENDAGGSPNNDGDKVQIWDCLPNDMQQQWYPWPLANGDSEFVNRFNTSMVLDARSDSGWGTTVVGTPLQLWTANYSQQQEWI
jgi:hypothetical protein